METVLRALGFFPNKDERVPLNQVYGHALLLLLRLRPPIVERGEEKPAAARFGPSTRMKQLDVSDLGATITRSAHAWPFIAAITA